MKISDFEWTLRGVTSRETGAYIPFSRALIKDILIWRQYYRKEIQQETAFQGPSRKVIVHPKPVENIYLLWGAMRHANLTSLTPTEAAELHFYFRDQTFVHDNDGHPPGLNRDCTNISKSHVAKVFEEVFGYSLQVDPRTATTPFICKSEFNGKHDGYIVYENCEPQEGWVYQKMIMSETNDGTVLDLRCPTVFGEVPLIYLKERPIKQRFKNLNSRCRLSETENHLNKKERSLISQFCQKMRLDWGGLDILRDAINGKIYIVDVNKTDMGPPLALPVEDKLRSTKILGLALRRAVDFHFPPTVSTIGDED
ncbi:hypothetical protein DES40_0173 [Litorimonas taeanensis]|uniref:ATP-grasp domain-containing protein n=1 Tax=Litorimonas taeanensis TaxID=568099 RepID=A0A420WIL1_9PROT|nr:hypothetical protein [Litorimonas taeanensis]RKQ70871.1 hypothetical protein DES40_0173 [Litorimonas taeanensis]